MNKNNLIIKTIIIIFLCLFAITLFAILLFNSSLFKIFDFTTADKVNISSVINGISTPIITLFSVILLYLTLSQQNFQSVYNKRSKNLELILTMYNQLETEYNGYSYRRKGYKRKNGIETQIDETHFGYDGLHQNLAIIHFTKEEFGNDYQCDKILGIISSYELVWDLIYTLELENDAKNVLIYKLDNFYSAKFKKILRQLAFILRENEDVNSRRIVDFVHLMERKYNKDFDIKSFTQINQLVKDT